MTKLFLTLFVLAQTVPERLKRDDRGATAVEYGLLVGLIAVVIIAAVTLFGTQISGIFTDATDGLTP